MYYSIVPPFYLFQLGTRSTFIGSTENLLALFFKMLQDKLLDIINYFNVYTI